MTEYPFIVITNRVENLKQRVLMILNSLKQHSFSLLIVHIVCMTILLSLLNRCEREYNVQKQVSAKFHCSFVNIFSHAIKCVVYTTVV